MKVVEDDEYPGVTTHRLNGQEKGQTLFPEEAEILQRVQQRWTPARCGRCAFLCRGLLGDLFCGSLRCCLRSYDML